MERRLLRSMLVSADTNLPRRARFSAGRLSNLIVLVLLLVFGRVSFHEAVAADVEASSAAATTAVGEGRRGQDTMMKVTAADASAAAQAQVNDEAEETTEEEEEEGEGRDLAQRKYVQTRERKGRKKQGGDAMTRKEMKILRLRRRRRRRRRKKGQTMADVGARAKRDGAAGTTEIAAKGALPYRIQDRVKDDGSSSEDKEFANRASSSGRTRDSMDDAQQQSQTESKGGTSSDDGPQMTAGAPVSDDARIRWRCAYPGENVVTTDIPASVSMSQQINFAPPAPGPSRPKRNSWLKGWSWENGGFGKRRGNNDGNRRAAEQSKGGGGGAQLVSSAAAEDDKLYILPREHRLCKKMQFTCPQICAARSDLVCRAEFTCRYRAPPSLVVASPSQEMEEERPPAQKRLPPLAISTSSSGKGSGKGGHASTYRNQAGGVGGKGGSSSDDYSTYKKHRDGRPRNLAEGGTEDEEDSFDVDAEPIAEGDGRDLQDSFAEPLRSLKGNSKGHARQPTPAPVGPQLTSVNVRPECTSTNNQLLPTDYYLCSYMQPPPEPECPEDLPEKGKDYQNLLEALPNKCKPEREEPVFLPPAPKPPVANSNTFTTDENTPLTANILSDDSDPDSSGEQLKIIKINGGDRIVGSPLTLGLPSGAELTVNPTTGDIVYDPLRIFEYLKLGDSFEDSFTYVIEDESSLPSNVATVTIIVTGMNDPPTAVDDTHSADPDVPISDCVFNNDFDPDGDTLTACGINGSDELTTILPSGATLDMGADGCYTLEFNGIFESLPTGETGEVCFTYEVCDGNGGTDEAEVCVVVTGKNDPPIATDDVNVTPNTQSVSGTMLTNDGDPDVGDSIAVTTVAGVNIPADGDVVISLPDGTTVAVNKDGEYTFDPNGVYESLGDNDTAEVCFDYGISDSSGLTSSAMVCITILGSNADPKAIDDVNQTDENNPTAKANVLTNDFDPNPDTELSVTKINGSPISATEPTVITLPSGAVLTIEPSGDYVWDPNGRYDSLAPGDEAVDCFTYDIADADGGSDQAQVCITIIGKNDPPVATDDTGTPISEDEKSTGCVMENDNDRDGDNLTVTRINGNRLNSTSTNEVIELPTGAILTLNPQTGCYELDPDGQFDSLCEGCTAEICFTYQISDGRRFDTAKVCTIITGKNNPPVAIGDDYTATVANPSVSDNIMDNDYDIDVGDVITITKITIPGGSNGEVRDVSHSSDGSINATFPSGGVITIDPVTGQMNYDASAVIDSIPAGETFVETFPYQIVDSTGQTAMTTVSITIEGGNSPPIANPDRYTATITKKVVNAIVLENDTDPDGDDLTVTKITKPAMPGESPVTVFPQTDDDGNMIISTTFATPFGDDKKAVLLMNTKTGKMTFDTTAFFDDIPAGDTYEQTFTYEIVDATGQPATTTVTIVATGKPQFIVAADVPTPTPPPTEAPTEEPTSTPSSQPSSDPTPKPTNAPPIAENNSYGRTVDQLNAPVSSENPTPGSIVGEILENDSDPDGEMGELNIASITPIGSGGTARTITGSALNSTVEYPLENGKFTINPDTGLVVYTPDPDKVAALNGNPGSNLTDTFTYIIADPDGGTDEATVSFTIVGQNDPPVPEDDSETVPEGDDVSDCVFENDSDPDEGDSLTICDDGVKDSNGFTIPANGTDTDLPEGGTLSITSDGCYTFSTSNGDFESLGEGETAESCFTYLVCDTVLASASAEVCIEITGENDPPVAEDDSYLLSTNTPVVKADIVQPNDSDPEGDKLTVLTLDGVDVGTETFEKTLASGGIIKVDPTTGEITYDGNEYVQSLGADDRYVDKVPYTISDGNGGTDMATITFIVPGKNDPPTPEDDSETVPEGEDVSDCILTNDSDPDGDALKVCEVKFPDGTAFNFTEVTQLPGGGTLTIGTDGCYVFSTSNGDFESLGEGETAESCFKYWACDEYEGSAEAEVCIEITGENDPPVAEDDSYLLSTNTPVVKADIVQPNDSDPEGDKLTVLTLDGVDVGTETFEKTLASGGIIKVDPTTGEITYDGNEYVQSLGADDRYVDKVPYTISDGNGGTDMATITFIVPGKNDPPTPEDDSETVPEGEDVSDCILTNDSDPDGDALKVCEVKFPDGTAFNFTEVTQLPGGGTLTIGTDGCYVFSTSNGDFESLGEGETAESCFKYWACDEYEGSAEAEVCIEITGENDPPVAEDDSYLLSTNTPVVKADIVQPNDSDPEGDKLTVLTLDGVDVGTETFEKTLASGGIIKVDPTTGEITYDGNEYVQSLGADDRYVDKVPYTISDGNGGTDMATITFIVPGKNDPPTPEDDSETVPEGEDVSDCILTNDSDPDGDALKVCEVKFPDGTAFNFTEVTQLPGGGTLTIGTDGCYVFSTSNGDFESLGEGETAESCFKYWACDEYEGSAEAEVCIEITGENDPPVAEDDSYLLSTNTPVVKADIVQPNDSDPEGDKLTVLTLDGVDVGTETFEKTLASGGIIKVDPTTGEITYDGNEYVQSLGADDRYVDKVPYTISDGNGGTDMATITFIVPGKNDPPTPEDDSETVPEGEDVSDCILTNDSDPDGDALKVCEVKFPDGTAFNFTEVTQLPGGGTLTIGTDGCYVFSTSNGDFESLGEGETAESCFKYWACDEYEGSAEAEVCIEITGENDPPVAEDDSYLLSTNTPVVKADIVQPNDSDPEGDKLTVLTLDGVDVGTETFEKTLASGGIIKVDPTTGEITYDGNEYVQSLGADDRYVDKVPYTISDGNGGTDMATITFIVPGKNDPPTPEDDSETVPEGEDVSDCILTNDSDPDGDALKVCEVKFPDGTAFNFTEVTQLPGGGTLTIGTDGCYVFSTSNGDFESLGEGETAESCFKYWACDEYEGSAEAEVCIEITGENDPPVAEDDSYLLSTNTPVVKADIVQPNDSDPEGDKLTVLTLDGVDVGTETFEKTLASGGIIKVDPTTGEITYDGNEYVQSLGADDRYVDKVPYTISDGNGGTDMATITFIVPGKNDPPTPEDDSETVPEGEDVSDCILTNDSDPDGDALKVCEVKFPDGTAFNFTEVTQLPGGGTLTIGTDGCYVFSTSNGDFESLGEGETAESCFKYWACDEYEGSAEAEVCIEITGENDPPVAEDDSYLLSTNTPVVKADIVQPNDSDPEGDKLTVLTLDGVDVGTETFEKTLASGGIIKVDPTTGEITYDGNEYVQSLGADDRYVDKVPYTISDGNGGTDMATITFIVPGKNDPPTPEDDSETVPEGEDVSDCILTNDSDPDGDALKVCEVKFPDGTAFNFTEVTQLPGGGTLTIGTDGCYVFSTSNGDFESLGEGETAESCFKYWACDEYEGSAEAEVCIEITGENDPPVAEDDSYLLSTNTPVVKADIVQPNDSDPEGDKLTVLTLDGVDVGTETFEKTLASGGIIKVDPTTGEITYDGNEYVQSLGADDRYVDKVPYTISDGNGGTDMATITFIVPGKNDPPTPEDDSETVPEGEDVSDCILTNDSDPDGDALKVCEVKFPDGTAFNFTEVTQLPGGGTLTIGTDGCYVFSTSNGDFESLGEGETAESCFKYWACDEYEGSAEAEVCIEITGENDPPVAEDDSYLLSTNTPVVKADIVQPNDSDPEGDKLTVLTLDGVDVGTETFEKTLASGGIIKVDPTTGEITYDGNEYVQSLGADDRYVDKVPYTISDGNGGTDMATITFIVPGKNDPPTPEDDSETVPEGEDVSDCILTNDSDPDGDALKVCEVKFPDGTAFNFTEVTQLPGGGTLTIGTDGCYVFSTSNGDFESLGEGETAESCFKYWACDEYEGSAEAEVCIEITGENDPPVAEDDSYLLSTNTPVVKADIVQPNDSDPEGDKLTVLTLDGVDVGTETFEKTLASGGIIKVDPTTGEITYDGNEYVQSLGADDRYVDKVPYTISDGNGGTDMATITFIVPGKNDPPTPEDDSETVPEGEDVSDCILTNDSDPDGDALKVCEVKFPDGTAFNFTEVTQLPGGGTLTIGTDGCYVFSTSNGDFESLGEGETAESCFKYWACDEYEGSAEAEVCIEITGENDPPVAEDDSYLLSTNTPVVKADIVQPNDSDPEGDKLTVLTLDGVDVGTETFEKTLASGGIIKVDPTTGEITYDGNEYVQSLGADDRYVDKVPYTISDGNGGTDMATITFIVPGKNDPPTPEDDSETVPEGEDVSDCILTNDSDPDGDALKVCEVKFPDGTAFNFTEVTQLPGGGTLTIGTDGCYVFSTSNGDFESLGEGETAESCFKYWACDEYEGSAEAEVCIEITGENDPPVAEDDSYLLSTNTPVVKADIVQPNDSDPEGDKLTVLTLDGVDVGTETFEKTLASGGIIKVDPTTGEITYDGNEYVQSLGADDRYVDKVPYTISDGNGGTDMATITFIVPGKNDPPTPEDDSETVPEGEDVSDCILTNDSDPDGDALKVCEVKFPDGTAFNFTEVTQLPGGGTLTIGTDGCYVFSTSNGDFESLGEGETAESCFKYWACDEYEGSAEAEVCIEITGENDPPVAEDDSYLLSTNTPVVKADIVQPNDSDPEGDKLTVLTLDGVDVGTETFEKTLASGGIIKVDPTTGEITYDGNEYVQSLGADDRYVDKVPYTISDGNGGTDMATITFIVPGKNDPPTPEDDSETVPEGEDVSDCILTNDSDPDGDALKVCEVKFPDGTAFNFTEVTQLPGGGTLTIGTDGCYVFSTSNGDFESLGEGETAESCFKYWACDEYEGSAEAEVCIEITGENDPPVAEDDSYLLPLGVSEFSSNIIEPNDSDPESNDLSIVAFDGSVVDPTSGMFQVTFGSGNAIDVDPITGDVTFDASATIPTLGKDDTFTETATYTISDGEGGTDLATITFVIPGVNDCPIASNETVLTRNDVGISGNVLANDMDPDPVSSLPEPVLSVIRVKAKNGIMSQDVSASGGRDLATVVTLPSGAVVTIRPNGEYEYDPNGAFDDLDYKGTATDSFDYVISDSLCPVEATVTIELYGDCACVPSATDETDTVEANGIFGTNSQEIISGNENTLFFEIDSNGGQIVFGSDEIASTGNSSGDRMLEQIYSSYSRDDIVANVADKEQVTSGNEVGESDNEPIPCRMGVPIADVRRFDADQCDPSAAPNQFPLEILSRNGKTITFTLSQVWKKCDGSTVNNMDWIAADFVVPGGELECFKTTKPSCGIINTYTAKCTEGLALIDLYAVDATPSGMFYQTDGSALKIPDACAAGERKGDPTKACHFRYVLSCMEMCEDEEETWLSHFKSLVPW